MAAKGAKVMSGYQSAAEDQRSPVGIWPERQELNLRSFTSRFDFIKLKLKLAYLALALARNEDLNILLIS